MGRMRRSHIKREPGSVQRGGRYVVIEDTKEIDTSVFSMLEESLVLEFYEGEWHMRHDYIANAGQTFSHSSFGGFPATNEALQYLREYQKELQAKRNRIDELSEVLSGLTKEIGKDVNGGSVA